MLNQSVQTIFARLAAPNSGFAAFAFFAALILAAPLPLPMPFFSMAALSAFSISLLFLCPRELAAAFFSRPLPALPILLLLSISLGHFFIDGSYKFEHLCLSLIWISIPSLAWLKWRSFERLLPPFLAMLWLLDAAISLHEILSKAECAGVPGNRNWHAALVILTAPFAARRAFSVLARLKAPKAASFTAATLVVAASCAILLQCRSKGAFLALLAAVAAGLVLEARGRRKRLLAWMAAIAIAATAAFFAAGGVNMIVKSVSADVRIPLWEGTAKLISMHPFFGVGGVSFESEFAPLRPAEYFFSRHVTVRTNHPHSHFLFIAAAFGFVGFAAWLLLLAVPMASFVKLYGSEANPDMKLLFLCLAAMLAHSMFDLVLYEWPTGPLSLAALGILWSRVWPSSSRECAWKPSGAISFLLRAAAIALAFLTAAAVFRTAAGTWRDRQACRLADASPELAARLHGSAVSTLKSDPLVLYRAMTDAYFKARNASLALSLLERFDETPWRNFAHNNGFRGRCLVLLGRFKESVPYFLAESANYPLQVLPLYNLAGVYWKRGMRDEARATEGAIAALMKAKGLKMEDLQTALENPSLDLRPWEPQGSRQASGGQAEGR